MVYNPFEPTTAYYKSTGWILINILFGRKQRPDGIFFNDEPRRLWLNRSIIHSNSFLFSWWRAVSIDGCIRCPTYKDILDTCINPLFAQCLLFLLKCWLATTCESSQLKFKFKTRATGDSFNNPKNHQRITEHLSPIKPTKTWTWHQTWIHNSTHQTSKSEIFPDINKPGEFASSPKLRSPFWWPFAMVKKSACAY